MDVNGKEKGIVKSLLRFVAHLQKERFKQYIRTASLFPGIWKCFSLFALSSGFFYLFICNWVSTKTEFSLPGVEEGMDFPLQSCDGMKTQDEEDSRGNEVTLRWDGTKTQRFPVQRNKAVSDCLCGTWLAWQCRRLQLGLSTSYFCTSSYIHRGGERSRCHCPAAQPARPSKL